MRSHTWGFQPQTLAARGHTGYARAMRGSSAGPGFRMTTFFAARPSSPSTESDSHSKEILPPVQKVTPVVQKVTPATCWLNKLHTLARNLFYFSWRCAPVTAGPRPHVKTILAASFRSMAPQGPHPKPSQDFLDLPCGAPRGTGPNSVDGQDKREVAIYIYIYIYIYIFLFFFLHSDFLYI